MIACDNKSCPIGWFHIRCLKSAASHEENGYVLIAEETRKRKRVLFSSYNRAMLAANLCIGSCC